MTSASPHRPDGKTASSDQGARSSWATVYLMVGLPGAGKTTRAKQIERDAPALRLTPDEWQIALFGDRNPARERDLVEGKLIEIGMRAAQLGTDVVLDFGLWSRDERRALRSMARDVGARAVVVYLPIDADEQLRRVAARAAGPDRDALPMTPVELAQWRRQFQIPSDDELAGVDGSAPPAGYPSWAHWASTRWPSLHV